MQPVNYSTGYKRVKQHIGVGLLIYTCLAVILEMAVILMITYLGLLRFFLTVGGGLGGQILNFPLEFLARQLCSCRETPQYSDVCLDGF